MKIRQEINLDENGEPTLRLWVDDEEEIYASEGEPEDRGLYRGQNYVFSILDLMKRAYQAGKSGESFEVTSIEEDGSEEISDLLEN